MPTLPPPCSDVSDGHPFGDGAMLARIWAGLGGIVGAVEMQRLSTVIANGRDSIKRHGQDEVRP